MWDITLHVTVSTVSIQLREIEMIQNNEREGQQIAEGNNTGEAVIHDPLQGCYKNPTMWQKHIGALAVKSEQLFG